MPDVLTFRQVAHAAAAAGADEPDAWALAFHLRSFTVTRQAAATAATFVSDGHAPRDAAAATATLEELETRTIQIVDLTRATLTNVDMSGSDLYGIDLRHSDLSGANLTGSDLTVADLTGSNLTGANLTDANMFHASLLRANLSRANMTGTTLDGVEWNQGTVWPVGFTPPSSTQGPVGA